MGEAPGQASSSRNAPLHTLGRSCLPLCPCSLNTSASGTNALDFWNSRIPGNSRLVWPPSSQAPWLTQCHTKTGNQALSFPYLEGAESPGKYTLFPPLWLPQTRSLQVLPSHPWLREVALRNTQLPGRQARDPSEALRCLFRCLSSLSLSSLQWAAVRVSVPAHVLPSAMCK